MSDPACPKCKGPTRWIEGMGAGVHWCDRCDPIRRNPDLIERLGKPYKVMTLEEYDRWGVESPHIVHWNYDGFGNVAWWPLPKEDEAAAELTRNEVEGARAKALHQMIDIAEGEKHACTSHFGRVMAQRIIERARALLVSDHSLPDKE